MTLLVSPAEAEALTLANGEGHIQLVLRNSTDQATAATGGRRLHELYGSLRRPRRAAPPPVPPARGRRRRRQAGGCRGRARYPSRRRPPSPNEMMVIRGAVKKVEVFSRERESK